MFPSIVPDSICWMAATYAARRRPPVTAQLYSERLPSTGLAASGHGVSHLTAAYVVLPL